MGLSGMSGDEYHKWIERLKVEHAAEVARLKAVNAGQLRVIRLVVNADNENEASEARDEAVALLRSYATAPATDTTGKWDAASPPVPRAEGGT